MAGEQSLLTGQLNGVLTTVIIVGWKNA